MKKFFASSIIALSFMVVPATMAAGSQLRIPGRHRHHHKNACKTACEESYRQCKATHGRHCKAERKACKRGCPK
jgi:hypothetical protein